jgi:hypothetical protein
MLAEHLCDQLHRTGDGTLVVAQHLIGGAAERLTVFWVPQQRADPLAQGV